MLKPSRSDRTVRRLGAAAVTLARAGAGPANELQSEAAQNAGERFGIRMARDHGASGNFRRIDARQQKELAMPDGDDLRMLLFRPLDVIRRVGDVSR